MIKTANKQTMDDRSDTQILTMIDRGYENFGGERLIVEIGKRFKKYVKNAQKRIEQDDKHLNAVEYILQESLREVEYLERKIHTLQGEKSSLNQEILSLNFKLRKEYLRR